MVCLFFCFQHLPIGNSEFHFRYMQYKARFCDHCFHRFFGVWGLFLLNKYTILFTHITLGVIWNSQHPKAQVLKLQEQRKRQNQNPEGDKKFDCLFNQSSPEILIFWESLICCINRDMKVKHNLNYYLLLHNHGFSYGLFWKNEFLYFIL